MLSFVIKIIKKEKKNYVLNDYKTCLLTCIFINLWPIIPTGNFFNNWLSIIYFLPVGFILHEYSKENI